MLLFQNRHCFEVTSGVVIIRKKNKELWMQSVNIFSFNSTENYEVYFESIEIKYLLKMELFRANKVFLKYVISRKLVI